MPEVPGKVVNRSGSKEEISEIMEDPESSVIPGETKTRLG